MEKGDELRLQKYMKFYERVGGKKSRRGQGGRPLPYALCNDVVTLMRGNGGRKGTCNGGGGGRGEGGGDEAL